MHHIAWNYFHYQFHNCILCTTHFWKTENQVTNLNSSQYMIHHRSLKLDTLSLGYVVRSLCTEWEDRRSIGKSPVSVNSIDRRSSPIQPNWYNHRHLGPEYFFSSILSITYASTTYMNQFDMLRCEINAFMKYAPFF